MSAVDDKVVGRGNLRGRGLARVIVHFLLMGAAEKPVEDIGIVGVVLFVEMRL